MHLSLRISMACVMLCLLAACSRLPSPTDLPIVYKIDIEQGNVITQDMLAQLRPGMDKAKVRFIMGTPIIEDTFHANRWDYIYSFSHRGGRREQRRVALFFEDDLLVQVDGNVRAAVGELKPEREKSAMVEVPGVYERSLIDKMKARVGLGDDAPEEGDDVDEAAKASGAAGAGVAAAAGEDDDATAQTGEGGDAQADEADAGKDKPGLFARMARRVGIGDDDQQDGDTAAPAANEAAAADDSEDESATETMVAKQSRPEESVLVPENAPPPKRDKGFFRSILEKVGIGDDGADDPAGPADRGYKDPTDIDQPF